MQVELTPQLAAMVRDKVDGDRYKTASDVVEDALRLLEERDRLQRLRAALAIGDEQIERGETVPFTPGLLERLRRRAMFDACAGTPIPDDVTP